MNCSRVLLLALCLVTPLAGCGSGNGCPHGYEPIMGNCVAAMEPRADAGGTSDAMSEDAGVADDANLDADVDAGPADDANVDARASFDAAGCPYAPLYADADGDGSGDPGHVLAECVAERAGYVTNATDCNDTCASCHVGGVEACNGADDDCDGTTDEGVTTTFYVDADGDAFGRADMTLAACAAPAGYAARAGDCDDTTVTSYPGAIEVCNGVDDNCDGATDEGVRLTFYRDDDGDGYGRAETTEMACTAPAGFAPLAGDCNDAVATIAPGAAEVCNGVDEDCDGIADDGLTFVTYYADCDRDGFNADGAASVRGCAAPTTPPPTCTTGAWTAGRSPSVDCRDNNAAVFPGQTAYSAIPIDSTLPLATRYDYNCDGRSETIATGVAACRACTGFLGPGINGWETTPPSCGGVGQMRTCTCTSPYYTSRLTFQGCR